MADLFKACAQDEAALLLHLSGNTVTDSTIEDGTFTVFIDSSLDTHMAVSVCQRDTVADLKRKVRTEHHSCFPTLGDIVIHAIKVKRRKFLYHLSDSMLVKSAFNGQTRTRFIHMDVSTFYAFKHQEEPRQVLSTPGINVQMEMPESLEAVSCKIITGTLKRLAGTATDESKDVGDIDNLGEDGYLIEGFTGRSDNPDDQLLHSQNVDLVNRKSIVSEQAVQGHGEENVLNVSDAVEESPTSDHRASISAEERVVDLDKLQKYDTRMDLNVDIRSKEGVNFNNWKSGIVSSDAAPSKSKRRNRGQGESDVDGGVWKGLLVSASEDEKERMEKRKTGLLELDNASSRMDVTVNASHTAENSDLTPPVDEDAIVDKSNCTPEDLRGENKSPNDIVMVKKKKKRIPKNQEVDHDNSSSYKEVIVDECNRKDSRSLKGTVDKTNIGSTNIIPQDGESKLSASCGMDEMVLKILPPVESYRDSGHVTEKKRKQPERTRNHVTMAPETPFVNHRNDSPGNELPLVGGHNNITNNGDATDQINGTVAERCIVPQGEADGETSTYNNRDGSTEKRKKSRKKVKNVDLEISAPDKLLSPSIIEGKCVQNKEGSSKMQLTNDGALTSKRSQEKSINSNMESIYEGAVEGGSDNHDGRSNNGDISDQINRTKSSERRSLYAETKKVDAGHMLSGNESVTSMKGLDIDSVPEKEITRAEDGMVSKDSKRKKSKKTESVVAETCIVPQVEADKVAPNAVGLDLVETTDESTYNKKGVGTERGKKSRKKVKNVDSEISLSGSQLLSPLEQMNLYAETKQVDSGYALSGNELLTSTKGIGIDAILEKEITQADDFMFFKVSKKKKSKKTESAVAERCIVPQLEADKFAANTVDPEHIESMDERSAHSKKGGSTEKGRSRKKVKNVDSEISMPDCKLLSLSTVKEKSEQDKQGSFKMQLINSGALTSKSIEGKNIKPNVESNQSIHEVAAEGDADHDDGCSSSSDRVKEKEIHRPQIDSANFIDYFVPGSKTDNQQVHNEGAASGKKTKKGRTGQNSSAPSRVANVSGKVHKGHAHQVSWKTSFTMARADDQNLDSSGSETLSSNAGSDDLTHDDGYLGTSAARNNMGSIGRKMVQTRSMTAGRLSEIFKNSSTCRKAVLQASKSKHERSKVDVDTDSPLVDTVAETQDSQAVTRLF